VLVRTDGEGKPVPSNSSSASQVTGVNLSGPQPPAEWGGGGPHMSVLDVKTHAHVQYTPPQYLTVDFTAPPAIVHEWVRCDVCKASPIKHIRYKCDPVSGCRDFDLCARCYRAAYPKSTTASAAATTATDSVRKRMIYSHDLLTHRMLPRVKPELGPRLLPATTLYDGMANICSNYDPLPCIGYRQRTKQG
jgi:hypothetical protein